MNPHESEKLWDHYQTEYRESFDPALSRLDLVFGMIRKLRPSGSVLDVGFGNGYLLKKLYAASYRCHGLDISKKNVAFTREEFEKEGRTVELRDGPLSAVPFENDAFDVVVASEVLEHLPSGEATVAAVREIARCLKAGGLFIGSVPADEDLGESVCFCPQCGLRFHRWGHQQSFDREKLLSLFRERFPRARLSVRPAVFRDARLNIAGKCLYFIRRLKIALGLRTSEAHYIIKAVK
ncbi:MAG: class I SAM-dependent methyltransferase [Endomicrobiales bacterium]